MVRTCSKTPLRSHLFWKRRDDKLEKKRREYLEQHAEDHSPDAVYPHIPWEVQLGQQTKEGSVSVCSSCNGLVHNMLNEIDLYAVRDTKIPECVVCLRGKYIRPQWFHFTSLLNCEVFLFAKCVL